MILCSIAFACESVSFEFPYLRGRFFIFLVTFKDITAARHLCVRFGFVYAKLERNAGERTGQGKDNMWVAVLMADIYIYSCVPLPLCQKSFRHKL